MEPNFFWRARHIAVSVFLKQEAAGSLWGVLKCCKQSKNGHTEMFSWQSAVGQDFFCKIGSCQRAKASFISKEFDPLRPASTETPLKGLKGR